MPVVSAQTMSSPVAWLACIMALILAANLLRCLKLCRGTTLTAACIWAIISSICLALFAALEALSPAQTIARDSLRFAAAVSTFCPIMAVLGAKRPQDRGWQWIVLSLWAITVWPAFQAALLPSGTTIELFIVWKLFLVGLIAIGLLNYLPTRFAFASILFAAAQLLLLGRYLWNWEYLSLEANLALTLLLINAAFVLTTFKAKRPAQEENASDLSNLAYHQQQWLHFRNAYGAFWGLRILARVNETAQLRHWPFRLTWASFEPHPLDSDEIPNETQLAELDQTLVTLLRRFNKLPDEQTP